MIQLLKPLPPAYWHKIQEENLGNDSVTSKMPTLCLSCTAVCSCTREESRLRSHNLPVPSRPRELLAPILGRPTPLEQQIIVPACFLCSVRKKEQQGCCRQGCCSAMRKSSYRWKWKFEVYIFVWSKMGLLLYRSCSRPQESRIKNLCKIFDTLLHLPVVLLVRTCKYQY